MTTVLEAPALAPAHPLWLAYQWELEKLTAQFRTRFAALVCLLGPVAFAAGLKVSSTVPADTLFGRWVHSSGAAVPLVVLGFAGSWGFPLVTCLVAGDIFSAEDHYQTWSGLLTRSVGRRSIFGGKVLAACTYAVAAVVLLALSSLAAGIVLVGRQPLVGLSGNLIPAPHATTLVLLSWLTVVPAALSFAAVGVLLSIATRNSLAAIIGPTVLGLVLQLLLLVGGTGLVPEGLPNASFVAWHGLWAAPAFSQPLVVGLVAAVTYTVACLWLGWTIFRRRDFGGA